MPHAIHAPVSRAAAALSSDALLSFLAKQRWFAAKGATPTSARIAAVVALPWAGGAFAIARVDVDVGGATHMYQLPLAARASGPADLPDRGTIERVDLDGARLVIYDAVHDAEFRRALIAAIVEGVAVDGEDARWIAEHEPEAQRVLSGNAASRVGSAEQSNTSIVIGNAAILKLFRTLKPGVHPDVEVTRFLTTHAGFANTPRLLGSIRLEMGGETMTTAMVQAFLPDSTDAWEYALDRGRSYFAAPMGLDAPPNGFLTDASRLGRITRALHEALASSDDDPAFAPEPITSEDIDRWAHRAQHMARESLALLERQLGNSALPKERLAEAQALVRRRDHYVSSVNEIDDALGDDLGMRTRVHGDYHLGQVLHTPANDFMIIDFEGEPSRPLDERREKTSPLRDVAGMLRSFAYAAATLAMSVEKLIDMRTRELRVARWERDVRAAFLDGYLEAPNVDEPSEFLPEDGQHVRRMIALFETEKVFYELAYELNNRPSWVGIPMRGISKLLVG